MRSPRQISLPAVAPLLSTIVPLLAALLCPATAAAVKVHTVALGAVHRVPYTPPEATADTKDDDATSLHVRALLVDDKQREWTVGPIHEVTDRTFVVQRAMHINDGLPDEPVRWTWQPGPWLMVDRVTARVTALHLPDFDPQVSTVVWYRDYAAYCGIATTVRGGLMAVVAELGARKAVVQQKLSAWPIANAPHPVCETARWQRTPIRATLQQTGGQPLTFDVVGVSSLVEEGESSDDQ
jgi:hypothetical protein